MGLSPRYIIYARKSTDHEDRQMLSIPSQLSELRALATRRGIVVAEELTEAHSARDPGRPVFSSLLTQIESGEVTGLLCWRLDRLARNLVDGGRLVYALGKGWIHEIVTPEGIYSGSGDSKFLMTMLLGVATKMTDDLSASVKRGNRTIYEQGRITGRPPLGYRKVRDRDGRRGAGLVVPDPERFDIVAKLWREMLLGTTSIADLWREAVSLGLTNPMGRNVGKPISLTHLYLMFHNRFYAGQLLRDGKVYRGDHVPVVTIPEFDRIQEILSHHPKHRPAETPLLYNRLLLCGRCGRHLTGERHTNRQGHHYTYYRCTRRMIGLPACGAKAPSEAQVTKDILELLPKVTVEPQFLEWAREALHSWGKKRAENALGVVASAEKALRATRREQKQLDYMLIQGRIAADDYKLRAAAQELRAKNLEHAIQEPTSELEAERALESGVDGFGRSLVRAFKHGADEDKRNILERTCSEIVVVDRKTTATLKNPFIWNENRESLFSLVSPKIAA
jgi:site-specific DNA recombinase